MRKLFFLSCALMLLLISCNNPAADKREKELEKREAALNEKEFQFLQEQRNELKKKEKELEDDRQKLEKEKLSGSAIPGSKPGATTVYYAKTYYGIFPHASYRLLTYADIKYLTATELKIMRNEIYARHGYIFSSAEWQQYFNKKNWYHPRYTNVTNMLTTIEKDNILLIQQYE